MLQYEANVATDIERNLSGSSKKSLKASKKYFFRPHQKRITR
jgi:hypothetical protein